MQFSIDGSAEAPTCGSLDSGYTSTDRDLDRLNGDSPLFFGLSPLAVRHITSCATPRTYARHEYIFHQGGVADRVILLETGSVKVSHLGSDGEEVIPWVVAPGETLGLPVPQYVSTSNSARALESSKALVWNSRRFAELQRCYPQLLSNIGDILTARLQQLEQRFREVATECAEYRLALMLLRLGGCIGKPSQHGINLPLGCRDLAQMTGTSLFTVSRILSKWEEQTMVIRGRQELIICDRAQLARVTGFAEAGRRRSSPHQRTDMSISLPHHPRTARRM